MRFLEFEKQISELEKKIIDLKSLSGKDGLNISSEVGKLQVKAHKLLVKTYSSLTPWQKVQVARHEDRPQFSDYLKDLSPDFEFLAGDRLYGEDQAILGGIGHVKDTAVVIIGQQKGSDTESRLKHNFGMAKPEGYRKAKRLIEMANKFNLPIISFVNTSGAYPGIDSEEHGQSEAIASCIQACVKSVVPIISVVIGEGGSGGAIAIATANKILMLEHAFYSVISPEGCASILWKTASAGETAAVAQKLTAQDLLTLGVIDEIIPEPIGGAHRNPGLAVKSVNSIVIKNLETFCNGPKVDLKKERNKKFLNMGQRPI